jgi:energy-coupling factor transport system permease protein
MFSFIDQDSWLHRRNPTCKFWLMLVIALFICFSYYPILPIVTVLLTVSLTAIGGKISIRVFLGQLKVFIFIAAVFMVSMFILRGISYSPDTIVTAGPFTWSERDLINILTLGFRIMAFVAMSISFVATTRPRDIALSLILQCKLDPIRGYAILAAYRFLPELQDYVQTIRLAQKIRGVDWNKSLASRVAAPFGMVLPLFSLAARRGETVACAMESRGLGSAEQRTYCVKTQVDKDDWIFVAVTIGIYAAITVALLCAHLFYPSFTVDLYGR